MVGQIGWLGTKHRPELTEPYRTFSSGLYHWTPELDQALYRTFKWLSVNELHMHQYLDARDWDEFIPSGRGDFQLALVYMRIVMFTDASHEWVSVTGYIIVLEGHHGSRILVKNLQIP